MLRREGAAWLLAITICAMVIALKSGDEDTNWSELAINNETHVPWQTLSDNTRSYSVIGDRPIHCDAEPACLNALFDSESDYVVWLGNSQLHAINQYEVGQELGSKLLYQLMSSDDDGLRVATMSIPSANLQEHLMLLSYGITYASVKQVVLGVVFDDFREPGLRMPVRDLLVDGEIVKTLRQTSSGEAFLDRHSPAGRATTGGEKASLQERTELLLESWLAENINVFGQRGDLRASVFYNLYRTRNYIFNINPSSKRRKIPAQYDENWRALEAILDLAKVNEVDVLMYIAPIRNDIALPYITTEYDAFKNQILALNSRSNVQVLDMEGLVQPSVWGLKDSTGLDRDAELDYMHFKYGGHVVLAGEIFRNLSK